MSKVRIMLQVFSALSHKILMGKFVDSSNHGVKIFAKLNAGLKRAKRNI